MFLSCLGRLSVDLPPLNVSGPEQETEPAEQLQADGVGLPKMREPKQAFKDPPACLPAAVPHRQVDFCCLLPQERLLHKQGLSAAIAACNGCCLLAASHRRPAAWISAGAAPRARLPQHAVAHVDREHEPGQHGVDD